MAESRAGVAIEIGGARRVRTDDPLLAKQVIYQLSYDPKLGGVML